MGTFYKMHPLLLFTLLFLPGIKCSYEDKKYLNALKVSGTENGESFNTDIAPIEEPRTVAESNNKVDEDIHRRLQLIPYESHISKKFKKYRNEDDFRHKSEHAFLSSKDHKYYGNKFSHDSSVEKKHKAEHNGKFIESYKNDNKLYYKPDGHKHQNIHNGNSQISRGYMKYKDSSEEKSFTNERKYVDKSKGLRDAESSSEDKKKHFEHISKKDYYKTKKAREYFKKHFNFDKDLKKIKRERRHTDSSESMDDEDYGLDEEVESEENKSDISMGSVEKQIFAHFLAGSYIKDDAHPFKDTIEVEFKEKSGEDDTDPVLEEKITKTMAYISCGEGDKGCGIKPQRMNPHQQDYSRIFHAEHGGSKKKVEENDDHFNMETWLKAFEDDIINTGVDVKYNHH